MKISYLAPLLSLCVIHLNASQEQLNIYSSKSFDSTKIAAVEASDTKGKLTQKNCSQTRNGDSWCKVTYIRDGIDISGYINQQQLELQNAKLKNKKNFEVHYGGNRDDVGKAILPLSDGAIIVGYTGSFGSGGDDAYVLRVDSFGNKIFSLALGGERDEVFKAIIAIDNGFMIAGTSRSIGDARDNVYVAKISNDGKLEWHEGYDSGKEDYFRANDIVDVGDGNVLVVGNQEKSADHISRSDIYLNLIGVDGERSIAQNYGGPKEENANSAVVVSDGYVLAGMTSSWGSGEDDAYVVKVDKQGKPIWHNTYGDTRDEVANQIIPTSDNGFIFVGTTESDVQKQKDIFVVKLSSNGLEQWRESYGTRDDEEGFGIVEVEDGYVIAGYTDYTPSHNSDVYILKIDKEGKVIFAQKHGGAKDDKAYAIAKDNDGFIVTGYTTTVDTYSKNVYVLRVDKEGQLY